MKKYLQSHRQFIKEFVIALATVIAYAVLSSAAIKCSIS